MTGLIIVGGKAYIHDVKAFLKSLNSIAKECGVTVQAVNADRIAGREHLEFATNKAIEAFREKTNLARDMGMEIMLYLRGKRQIEKALEMGVMNGMNNIAIAILGDNADCAIAKVRSMLDVVDDSVIDYSPAKDPVLMEMYGITPAEIEIVGHDSIPALVRERSALLEFEK